MNHKAELGDFLRSRRARLRPEDAGLRAYGERRRVPGLRREELAQLAGVSADYYVRFEQGRTGNVSSEIVDAVAGALRLDGDERAHLHRLVQAAQGSPGAADARSYAEPQEVRPGLLRLLESMPHTPAFIAGRRTDVLAWNPLFAVLVADPGLLPPGDRNKARMVFLDPEVRGRFVNWETKARDMVAYLRLDAGRHPGDPALAALVAELGEGSAEFRRLWAEHEVKDKSHGGYHLRHPELGEFTLAYETFRVADDDDQLLITYTAEAGSPSEAGLRVLVEQIDAAQVATQAATQAAEQTEGARTADA
ncbi:helix-turn-helix transcriptional regulator [Yinghuangia sp. YIM S09857]|uniref:helix-turn-helix transcriptional regulator n=1 Tax=Yinghuangia sp. YIM S09857 TaxID=3436929 RepID=UPI003F53412D